MGALTFRKNPARIPPATSTIHCFISRRSSRYTLPHVTSWRQRVQPGAIGILVPNELAA